MSAPQDTTAQGDPWQRYGWLMWGIWLIFLVFPLVAVLGSSQPWAVRTLGVALVLGFAAAYVVLVQRMDALVAAGRAGWALVALAAFPVALAPVIGVEALGLMPFLSSYAAFALPRPLVWWVCAGIVATAAAGVALSGGWEMAWFLIILVAVTVGTGGGRLMADQGEAYGRSQQELALTGERERVARDVHDVLGHSLTVVTLKAQLAQRLVDVDPEAAKRELVELEGLAREALTEIRATVGGLRAAVLAEEVQRAGEALAAAGIAAELPEDVQVVDPARRSVVAWALRESVTNVVRHSGAARCRVELGTHSLVVSDDGCGTAGTRPGNGLHGLRERVEGAGGRLEIGSAAEGRGTRVKVSW